MNKFKKILLGAVSVLTLGLFVVTGTKVDAATLDLNFDYKPVSTASISKGTSLIDTSEIEITTNPKKDYAPVTPYNSTSTYTNSDNDTYSFSYAILPGGNSNTYNNIPIFINVINENVTIDVYWTATDGSFSSKSVSKTGSLVLYSVSGENITASTTYSSITTVNTSAYKQTVSFSNTGSYALGHTASRLAIFGIIVNSAMGESELIQAAENAITEIGTVEYTITCYNKITAATNALNKITAASTKVSNYSAYTTAVSTFNSLANTAKNNFITSVDAIGEVTTANSETKTKIEAAKSYYSALLGDELADENVISKKTILDDLESTFNELNYDNLSRVANANNCTLSDGITEKVQADDSIFSLLPACKVNSSAVFTYDDIEYTQRMQTAGSVGFTDNEVSSKAISFEAKEAGVLKVLAMSASASSSDAATRTLNVYRSGSKTAIYTSDYLPVSNAQISYIYVNIPSAGTYYIGSSVNNISIYYLEFIETSISAPVLEQQENADNTAIRYIATLSNVSDINEIVSWNATITVDTKSHTFANQTAVYTSVAGTNGKEEATNTYYLVATLKNIPTTFTGTITCRFNVTLTNGTVQSNIISYTID